VQAQPAAKPAASAAAPVKAVAVYVYETKNRRDPFRPLIIPRVESQPAASASPASPAGVPGRERVEAGRHRLGAAGLLRSGRGAQRRRVRLAGETIRSERMPRVTKITSDIVAFDVKSGPGAQAQQARVVELRLRKEE